METLKLVGAGRRQPQSVAVFRQLPAGIQHYAAQRVRRLAMQRVNLPPKHVAHLPKGRRSAQHDAGVVLIQIPQHGHGGGEVLAQAVARLHRHAPLPPKRFQHFLLLAPQIDPQRLRRKLRRIYRLPAPAVTAPAVPESPSVFPAQAGIHIVLSGNLVKGLRAVRLRRGQG